MVIITAGEEAKTFYVHQKIICALSPYFRAAYTGGFQEATTKEIRLVEMKPKVVALIIQFAYSGHITSVTTTLDKPGKAANTQVTCELAVDLYIAADMLQITCLKSVALNKYRSLLFNGQKCPTVEDVIQIYRLTSENAVMRKFMVSCIGWALKKNSVSWNAGAYFDAILQHPQFGVDLANVLFEKKALDKDPRSTSDQLWTDKEEKA